MKVRNPEAFEVSDEKKDALAEYMKTRKVADFDELRRNVAGFADMPDGHIHETALAAKLEVTR